MALNGEVHDQCQVDRVDIRSDDSEIKVDGVHSSGDQFQPKCS